MLHVPRVEVSSTKSETSISLPIIPSLGPTKKIVDPLGEIIQQLEKGIVDKIKDPDLLLSTLYELKSKPEFNIIRSNLVSHIRYISRFPHFKPRQNLNTMIIVGSYLIRDMLVQWLSKIWRAFGLIPSDSITEPVLDDLIDPNGINTFNRTQNFLQGVDTPILLIEYPKLFSPLIPESDIFSVNDSIYQYTADHTTPIIIYSCQDDHFGRNHHIRRRFAWMFNLRSNNQELNTVSINPRSNQPPDTQDEPIQIINRHDLRPNYFASRGLLNPRSTQPPEIANSTIDPEFIPKGDSQEIVELVNYLLSDQNSDHMIDNHRVFTFPDTGHNNPELFVSTRGLDRNHHWDFD